MGPLINLWTYTPQKMIEHTKNNQNVKIDSLTSRDFASVATC